MSKITVTVQFGRYSDETRTVCREIDDFYRDEICQPLRTSDPGFPIRETPPEVVYAVRRLRANAAKDMAQEMTAALIKAFGADDRHNGYSHEENEKFRGVA